MMKLKSWSMVRVARFSSMPWLMLSGGEFYSLGEKKVMRSGDIEQGWERVGSSHGWIAALNKNKNKERICLVNPLSGRRIDLPLPFLEEHRVPVGKVILSCPPDRPDCIAVASSFTRTKLAYCFPARPCPQWTCLPCPHAVATCRLWHYDDFTYLATERVLTGVGRNAGTFSVMMTDWDLDGPAPATAKHNQPRWDSDRWQSHVDFDTFHSHVNFDLECLSTRFLYMFTAPEDPEQRFVVVHKVLESMYPNGSYAREINYGRYKHVHQHAFPYKTICFYVCRLNRETGTLRILPSLDGLAIFVGLNHTFALRAADYPPLKPNSIYFTDSLHFYKGSARNIYGGHDIGVYDYDTGAITPCYYPTTPNSIIRINPTPLWFQPDQH